MNSVAVDKSLEQTWKIKGTSIPVMVCTQERVTDQLIKAAALQPWRGCGPVACENCSDEVGGARAIETVQCNSCEQVDKANGRWNKIRRNHRSDQFRQHRNVVERTVLNRFTAKGDDGVANSAT